jgi:hypothetical protein
LHDRGILLTPALLDEADGIVPAAASLTELQGAVLVQSGEESLVTKDAGGELIEKRLTAIREEHNGTNLELDEAGS